MKSLAEFQNYYNQQLLPEVLELEKQRKTVASKVLAVCIPITILTAILTYFAFSADPEAGTWVLILGLAAAGGIGWMMTRDYVSDFKDIIIKRIVWFIEPSLRYDKLSYIPLSDYKKSKIFPTHVDRYSGDDRVTGTLDATRIDFSEIHSEYVTRDRKGRTSYHTIFKGLFFIADFNKHFKGQTFVLPDRVEKLLGGLGNMFQKMNVSRPGLVKLEDPEFERMFVVYGTDQVESRYILSTSLMNRIVNFKKKTSRNVYMSFVDSNVYIAISYFKNLFEPKIFHTLLDFKPIQEYFEDLQLASGIVEDLNLNTRIWSKT